MTVYIVYFDTCYQDKNLCGVFAQKKDAQDMVDSCEDSYMEEYKVIE